MFRRFTISFVFLTLATVGAVACAGGGTDAPSDGAGGALSKTPKAGSSASANSGPGGSAPGSLKVTGDALTIAEAVLIHDQTQNDDGSQTPTARIIFSNKSGICNRMDQGYTLAPDEKMFSLRVKQPAFSTGKVTFTADTTTSACAYVDNDAICGQGGSSTAKGTGTLDVTTVSASSLAGSVDVTVGARQLQGSFTATACPDGKVTNNFVNCGVAQGDSVDEGGDGPATGTGPSPAPSGSSTASK